MIASLNLLTISLILFAISIESRYLLKPRQAKVRGGASETFKTGSQAAIRQAKVAQTRGALGKATDGSQIVAMTADIDTFALQFKISAPQDSLLPAAKNGAVIQPSTTAPTSNGVNGANVLLHGDGGQTFFDFSNQAVQNNLMGVVVLAPNDKMFWGGGAGSLRTDGALHSTLVNKLITQVLPQVMNMDPKKVFFTGVSGGSLTLSGFFMPMFAENYNTGAIMSCGGLSPQVKPSENFGKTLGTMKIHFQTTTQELTSLQSTIPGAITTYADAAKAAGVDDKTLGTKLTADSTPTGSHCAFDGRGFVSGVQRMSDTYGSIIFGDGNAKGIGKAVSVLENKQTFASGIPVCKAVAGTLKGKATRP
ncbi:hypothetical protein BY996DRAFT_4578472 [Phakopsora pachyrhizi]|uniref:Cyclin-like f-box protein n=1 Tax=Phakopsora pachyrhizi TaxID=170000 RepID=A0AAV0BRH6_PHAPC|nr:hypothetical protein BY996DRAFT_4578472 [Phakopsora pachyrhizi]CAH7688171.1 hypothetical protein PPACK8108_LOCUS23093 [Phakopsora pachyrhizi]